SQVCRILSRTAQLEKFFDPGTLLFAHRFRLFRSMSNGTRSSVRNGCTTPMPGPRSGIWPTRLAVDGLRSFRIRSSGSQNRTVTRHNPTPGQLPSPSDHQINDIKKRDYKSRGWVNDCEKSGVKVLENRKIVLRSIR